MPCSLKINRAATIGVKRGSNKARQVAYNCSKISREAPQTFHEAVQSFWFLFVILHMESNASSFSPGRLDEILWDYYETDIKKNSLTRKEALEIIECL